MVLRSVGVLSCGKVLGVLYAAMGLVLGLIFALISAIGLAIPQPQAGQPNPMAFMVAGGVVMIIVLPVVYGVMGYLFGVIMAALYNVAANMFGGLELYFQSPASDPSEVNYP